MQRSKNRGFDGIHFIGIVVALGIVGLLVFGESDSDKRARMQAAAPPAAEAQDRVVAGPDFFGCLDKDRHNALLSMLAQKDEKAFTSGLARSVKAGDCALLQPGAKVFLRDVELTTGLIRIRPEGSEFSYWAVRQAMSK